MSVPSSVQYFASKLADYELTPISLDTMNGLESFKENDIIEFEMPSSSVVDLDSLRITFGAFCDGATSGVTRLPEDIHKLIRRVEVSCGSELLGHAYDQFGRLKHHIDAITGQAPHPTSHPRILRQGLNQATPLSISKVAADKQAAVAAALAAIPHRVDQTTTHLHLKAPITGPAPDNTVYPVTSTVNIVSKHSATKLNICVYAADGYTKIGEFPITWTALSAALELDGANLVTLLNDVLGFTNYTVDAAIAADIATKVQAYNDALEAAAFATENETAVGGVRFTWDKLGGFLETAEPRMMDLAILPPLIIRIHTAGREVLCNSATDEVPADFGKNAVANPGDYTIKFPRLTFDAVSMGSPYDSYVNAVLAKKQIKIPFKTYRHYNKVDYINGIDIATSTRSLDRVMWAVSNKGERAISATPSIIQDVEYSLPGLTATALETKQYFNVGEKYHAVRFLSSYDGAAFSETPDVNAKYTLTFNGIVQPNRNYDSSEWFTNTTNSLSEYRNPWNAGLTFPQWLKQSALCCYRLNRVGSTVQTASGVDTRNSVMQMQIQTPMGLSEERQIDVWLESTALLTVAVGREFTVEM